jgi:hypothetical protein
MGQSGIEKQCYAEDSLVAGLYPHMDYILLYSKPSERNASPGRESLKEKWTFSKVKNFDESTSDPHRSSPGLLCLHLTPYVTDAWQKLASLKERLIFLKGMGF